MDAVEFLKERKRLCKMFSDCYECPLSDHEPHITCKFGTNEKSNEKGVVDIVEQWSKEHPVKTRQSEFFSAYPDAPTDTFGLPCVRPCDIDKHLLELRSGVGCSMSCQVCRRDCWLQEVE